MGQLGSNLGPAWPPKSFQNRSQDDVKTQLPEKLIFATSPMRNARFCFPKGLPKRSKTHSKTTCYTSAFSTSKKLGSLLGLPRHLQGASKASLKPLLEASWAILAANSFFLPPWGCPRAQLSSISFYQKLKKIEPGGTPKGGPKLNLQPS